MKKILVVCTSGLGTSLALRTFINKFARKHNLNVRVEHTDLGSANFMGADLIIGAKQVVDCLPPQEDIETIALEDIVKFNYIAQKLLESKTIKSWLAGSGE